MQHAVNTFASLSSQALIEHPGPSGDVCYRPFKHVSLFNEEAARLTLHAFKIS